MIQEGMKDKTFSNWSRTLLSRVLRLGRKILWSLATHTMNEIAVKRKVKRLNNLRRPSTIKTAPCARKMAA